MGLRALMLAAALIYGTLVLLMAVLPGALLSAAPVPAVRRPLTAMEARGRDVYVAEGCSYCHTQQVRPLAQDRVWGRASVAGDYAGATPQLLGTERNGPDLANVGARQPSVAWHAIHLYQPRALVANSIMPAYPWLFITKFRADAGDDIVNVPAAFAPRGKIVVTTQVERDLVAYLRSLVQSPAEKSTR